MDMLKSEVKLLLLRNAQLENEETKMKQSELLIKKQLYHERQLTRVLEQVKSAQNEYIAKLNALLIELTHEDCGTGGGDGSRQSNGGQFSYSQIRSDINNCVDLCKRLQDEYIRCKRSAAVALKTKTPPAVTSTPVAAASAVTATTASISNGFSATAAAAASTASTSTPMATNGTAIKLKPNATFPSIFTATATTSTATTSSLDTTETSTGAPSLDNGLIDTLVADDTEDDDYFVYEDMDDDDDSQEMPELDLIDFQMDDYEANAAPDTDDDDADPNGAGEDYLDMTDTEFIPKRTLPKGARKTFPNNGSGVMLSPPKRQRKTDKNRGFKTSAKFGDKFRCNWKDCDFISSYKQNVERHYRVHTGERPFKCQFKGCLFSASQAGNLKVHQQRHGHHTPNAQKFRIKSTHNAVRAEPND